MSEYNILSLIDKKKYGMPLSKDEIRYIVKAYTDGSIPDYQMSSFLMAVCINSMTAAETAAMTEAMRDSGEILDLSAIDGIKVDKHSTGGVGDKTTPVLLPLAAVCGGKVAKMSGRGLGHTGGTIDKLESIDGFCTELGIGSFINQVKELGGAISSQLGNLVPADKKIYSLRDVTATVDSIPLIASSVMSKKLASGADAVVLDVKFGSGAFITDKKAAEALASLMVEIGEGCGKKMKAFISDMNKPLGRMIGNCLEIAEAVEVLKGGGADDLRKSCLELAAGMLEVSGSGSFDDCYALAQKRLSDGSAFEKFCQITAAQGGNVKQLEDTSLLRKAPYTLEIKSNENGSITDMNTKQIGNTAVFLGAGRTRLGEKIDHSAGIEILAKTGDSVSVGDTIAILHTSDEARLSSAKQLYNQAVTID